MRLHDLSGALLFHYLNHNKLPADLSELRSLEADKPLPPAVCPVSSRPYVYNAGGIFMQEQRSYVVLYDPAPSHSHMRWAVTLPDPNDANAGGSAPVTKVIALPESFFLLHPPA